MLVVTKSTPIQKLSEHEQQTSETFSAFCYKNITYTTNVSGMCRKLIQPCLRNCASVKFKKMLSSLNPDSHQWPCLWTPWGLRPEPRIGLCFAPAGLPLPLGLFQIRAVPEIILRGWAVIFSDSSIPMARINAQSTTPG